MDPASSRRAALKGLETFGIKHRRGRDTTRAPSSASASQRKGESVFGCSVDRAKKCTVDCCGLSLVLPEIVRDACEHLRGNARVEGLFRKGGSQSRQRDIKALLENGGRFDGSHHAVDVASLLKLYLRSLPEPIIGADMQDLLLRCLLLGEDVRLGAVRCALLLLPVSHLHILHYTMEFLNYVALKEDDNRMDPNNLAIVLAPTLMPPPVTATQARISQHIVLIKLLIENPTMIGSLPEPWASESETTNDRENEAKIKKKRRSGSLTRVFSGLKKIVSGGNHAKAISVEPPATPVIKDHRNKRKHEVQQGLSAKKRREVLEHLPMQSLAMTPMKAIDRQYDKPRLSISRMSRDKLVLADNPKEDPQMTAVSGIVYRRKTDDNSTNPEHQKENDYVRISKSEYEDIKNRVSAIESKISREFETMNSIGSVPVKNIQCAYEKTLEESAMLNLSGSEQLARRLSRELKIRRSDEHKIIRSPSARKIDNLKRRSQEHVRLPRTATWSVPSKTEDSVSSVPKIIACSNISLKRGRPNTINTGLPQPCINTNSIQSVADVKRKISLTTIANNETNELNDKGKKRSFSFHGDNILSKSRVNIVKISTPDKSNTSDVKWTSASTFLSSAENSHNLLTGRASVAQLRSQNAGMVMAKARLFDAYSDSDNSSEKNLNPKEPRPRTSFARKPRKLPSQTHTSVDIWDGEKPKALKSQILKYRNNPELSSQLKEVIYDTCTPDVDKLKNSTPVKKNDKIDVIFKTPRATPPIKKPLSEKSIRNPKLSHSLSAKKLNTPLRGNHAIPRRQSPRLLNMKSRIIQH